MSGHLVPYQLRTNKYVERHLFVDALDFTQYWLEGRPRAYASMGGPFLEDFRFINERLAIEKMVSIEADEDTWRRQQLNKPYGFIDCRHQRSDEFITNIDQLTGESQEHSWIVWLDYADANARYEQLQEFEELVGKLASGDVAKVTLNANPYTKLRRAEHPGLSNARFDRMLAGEIGDELDTYCPADGVPTQGLNEAMVAKVLAKSVGIAAQRATQNTDVSAKLLLGCRYKDGEHQMLTMTVLICDEELESRVDSDPGYESWDFRSTEWDDLTHVQVPVLSLRERSAIDTLLESADDAYKIHKEIGIKYADSDGTSISMLKSYVLHYRRYPSFGRVFP